MKSILNQFMNLEEYKKEGLIEEVKAGTAGSGSWSGPGQPRFNFQSKVPQKGAKNIAEFFLKKFGLRFSVTNTTDYGDWETTTSRTSLKKAKEIDKFMQTQKDFIQSTLRDEGEVIGNKYTRKSKSKDKYGTHTHNNIIFVKTKERIDKDTGDKYCEIKIKTDK